MGGEDLIWDRITESAMSKFDFAAFQEEVAGVTGEENVAENIVFMTIVGFASGKDDNSVAESIYNQIILSGFVWEFPVIEQFVSGKKEIFKLEIYATNLAYSLLEETKDTSIVLTAVNQLL